MMKNLFSFSFLIVIVLFNSCSKDASLLSELDVMPSTETKSILLSDKIIATPSEVHIAQSSKEGNKTIQLQVINSFYSAITNDLTVHFSGSNDYTTTTPLVSQTLNFSNSSSFSHFLVQNYTGGNGFLEITFDVSSYNLNSRYNLNNWDLLGMQEIIIQEEVVE